MNEVHLRIEEQQAVIAGLEAERLLHAKRGDVGIVHAITALLAGERARLEFWLRRAQAREDVGTPITLLVRPALQPVYKRVIAAATVTMGSASTSHIVIEKPDVHTVHVILNRRNGVVWAMRIHDDGAGVWWKAPNMLDEAALTNTVPLPPGSELRVGAWQSNPTLITIDPT